MLHPLGGEVDAHWLQDKTLEARATGEPARSDTTDTTETTAEMLFHGHTAS